MSEPNQAEFDQKRAEIDIAKAKVEGLKEAHDALKADESLSPDLLEKISQQLSSASAVVRDLEDDAKAKGIPLTLSGNRYRIYIT